MELIAIIIALIVPIGVAIWTVRSSAKDTAQQIAALEESTQKQVESVKELAKLQIEISKLQMSKELSDARNQYLKVSKKSMDQIDNRHAMLGLPDSLWDRYLGMTAAMTQVPVPTATGYRWRVSSTAWRNKPPRTASRIFNVMRTVQLISAPAHVR